ncbi:30S ribosomal protein S5 alanine N-acetyltransferase [candidate division KSB3 bacterium]|uniref:30S ribosomal protein S5 alanine N-acetyltransferase n=1 Tax=candidate division KSB3 bacterium TaxID=2044937 RepID=A0A9D5JZ93_9BACT|nr:30S ribosomal protein S5 alanine N-acetyltransferase [candidate division KSB3 bacterium]MBD3327084.1 30S ribosomal protein S5 alanine N-acetyltransferase [candidate division KSB3 bacterium]
MAPKTTGFPLETERLLLRLPVPQDAKLLVRYYSENQHHLTPWEPRRSEAFYTVTFWETLLADVKQELCHKRSLRLIVFLKESPKAGIIGVCNFTNVIHGVFQACHLGYSIDYRYEGRGLMYEALTAAIDFVFSQFRLHRIMANYLPRNERSGKLLRRLGFTPEGYARDYLKIAGKWEDHILTSLIRPVSVSDHYGTTD